MAEFLGLQMIFSKESRVEEGDWYQEFELMATGS
jgi:hypothetical protein